VVSSAQVNQAGRYQSGTSNFTQYNVTRNIVETFTDQVAGISTSVGISRQIQGCGAWVGYGMPKTIAQESTFLWARKQKNAGLSRTGHVQSTQTTYSGNQPMSVLVQCPSCGARLRLPETAGRRPVRCPKCAETFRPEERDANEENRSPQTYTMEGPPPAGRSRPDRGTVGSRRAQRRDEEDSDEDDPATRRRSRAREDSEEQHSLDVEDFEERSVASGRLLPGARIALATTILLLVLAGIDLVFWVFEVMVFLFLISGSFNLGRLLDYERTENLLLILRWGLFFGTAILFSFWFYRVYANLELLKAQWLEYTPGWAVGYLYIPIIQLFKPCQVAQEIWKASNPSASGSNWKEGGGSNLIGGWWAAWVAGLLIGRLGMLLLRPPGREGPVSLGALKLGAVASICSILLVLVADVLLVLVIRGVMRRQEKKYRRVFRY
jgi:hypothetical protein